MKLSLIIINLINFLVSIKNTFNHHSRALIIQLVGQAH